jgi:Domain of unknown function (DUF3854)
MGRESLTEEYLVTNRTKRASRGWKAVCPSCSGNDLWYTVDTNSAYCFECGTAYKVGDAPEVEKAASYVQHDLDAVRRVYDSAKILYRDCLVDAHKLYLQNRGIDNGIIDAFQIGFCPPTSIPLYQLDSAKLAGLCDVRGRPMLGGRVVFPYEANSQTTDMRGRALASDVHPRYVSPRVDAYIRGAVYPFNYDRAVQRAQQTRTIIVTEGEIKAILADAHGFAAVALPGMLTWRHGLLDLANTRLVMVFDNSVDKFDRLRVDKALARLYSRLPPFDVGVLPLLGEEKQDIDSFLLHPKGGYNNFVRVVESALSYKTYRALRRF